METCGWGGAGNGEIKYRSSFYRSWLTALLLQNNGLGEIICHADHLFL
jgi:hypothetical protein